MKPHYNSFEAWLIGYNGEFAPVVPFTKGDKFLRLDFTAANTALTDDVLKNTNLFIQYINKKLGDAEAKYGVGGYGEDRVIYRRSSVFDAHNSEQNPQPSEQPRSVHLGLDIWGPPYTKVMTPLDSIVHSFAFNNAFGDYGATIILTHNLDGKTFHSLYGHLSLNSIKNLHEGDTVRKGDVIAEFGIPFENGQWPPHLHFQLIRDMQGMRGDYPGVCTPSEKQFYLNNCPDADIIAGMMKYADRAS